MKNIFRRLTGILLVFVLLVTTAPVAFATPTSTRSREFTINGNEYVAVPSETITVNGKTYYGVVSKNTTSYTWNSALFRLTYLSENTAGATGVDIPVKVNILNGRDGTSADLQSYLSAKFADFGNYVAPSDTEWVLSTANGSKVYYTGSVGLPNRSTFTNLYKYDKYTCSEGDGGFVLGDLGFYNDYYYLNMAGTNGKTTDSNPKINGSNAEVSGTNEGGTWVFMTYVSEDFFKNNIVDLNICGNRFLTFLYENFTKADLRGAGYTEEEVVYIGFPAGTQAATGVTLDKTVLNINANTEGTIKAFVQPLYEVANENVTWSSADTSIATVNENGVVYGKKIGQTTITATTEDGGFTADCTVNVTPCSAFYVAPNGDDDNLGTIEEPFATVQKAVDTMQLGDTVYLREGTYEEAVEINKSGTASAPLNIAAYNGEKAVITGTQEIKNWTVDKTVGSNTIYKAYVGKTFDEDSMIFFNNSYVDYAKWPNNTGVDNNPIRANYHDKTHPGLKDNWLFQTWGFLDSATGRPSSESEYNLYYGTIYDSDLTFGKDELIGATMVTKPGLGWYMYYGNITDSDVGSFYIKGTMQFHEYYLPTKGNQYYLYGAKCLLDYKNEWYSDDEGYLYIITPDGTDPNKATITANVRQDAIDFNGNDYINVDGIDFFAGEIRTEDCDNLRLTNISNEYVSTGPALTGNNNILANSTIKYTIGQSLFVGGNNNKVINNLIEYSCSDGTVRAVFMSDSKDAVIAYNTIRFVGSTGIDLNNRGGALIIYNDISYYSAVCRDNGAMYGGFADGVNMEIAYNWVHDGMSNAAAGIYPDNSCSNIIIHHNVGWNMPWGLLINSARASILAYNNTFEGNSHTYPVEIDFSENIWSINNLFSSISNLSRRAWIDGGTYIDADRYCDFLVNESNSLKSDSALSSIKGNDFYPSASSAVVNKGKVIKGITDGYVGSAPDIGAYEYGAEKWIPGHDFSDTARVSEVFEKTEYVPYMNYIQSGGFETSLSDYSWELTGNKTAQLQGRTSAVHAENAGVHLGNNGLRLGSENATTGTDGIKQTITNLLPNTRYHLMSAGRVDDTNVPIEMTVTGAASTDKEKVVFDNFKWDERMLTFVTGETGEVTVNFSKNATGYGYIDTVMLYEATDQGGSDDGGSTEPEDHTATSPNYIKLANGTKLLYNGVTDGDYLNFILAKDLAGRYGSEGFVIANNQYYISSAWAVNSGTSVSDAAMAKLPATMVDYVQSRPYAVNVAGGATEHVNTTLKASVPSHDTLDAHAEYIQPLIDDNETITCGGGFASAGYFIAAVNDWHPWFHYAFPNGVVASDGNYFTGSVFAEFYVHKDFFKAVKLDTATVGKNVQNYISANFNKADFASLGYTDDELTALGFGSGSEDFEKIELIVEKTVNAVNNTIDVEACIKNNTRTPIPAGTYLVVAAYSGNILSDVKFITLEGAISANATSGVFTPTLAAKDVAEENTVKVMLWSGINYLKPLCEVVIK